MNKDQTIRALLLKQGKVVALPRAEANKCSRQAAIESRRAEMRQVSKH